MKPILFIIFSSLLYLNSAAQTNDSKQRNLLPAPCEFSISEAYIQANVTFSDGFIFKTDKTGKPFDIKRLTGKDLIDEEARECLSRWRFEGFNENTRISIIFTWKHGVGWYPIKIHSRGFSRTLKWQKILKFNFVKR
jgi:hypothetical protein